MFQDSEIDAITTGDPFGCPPHGKYEKLISLAKQVPPATTVVVYPCDETSLRGAIEAAETSRKNCRRCIARRTILPRGRLKHVDHRARRR